MKNFKKIKNKQYWIVTWRGGKERTMTMAAVTVHGGGYAGVVQCICSGAAAGHEQWQGGGVRPMVLMLAGYMRAGVVRGGVVGHGRLSKEGRIGRTFMRPLMA